MIKFSATNALVHSVSPVIEIASRTGGQPFCKRELIIDDSWDKDGNHYSNFVSIEFTGDKMSQLDSVYPGMRVNVDGLLNGREYNNRIYNTVRGLSVTPYQSQQQYASASAPMPGYAQPQPQYQQAPGSQSAPMPGGYPQQSAPSYPQQPAYPQQAQHPQQYAQAPSQQSFGGQPSPGVNDLPFSPR